MPILGVYLAKKWPFFGRGGQKWLDDGYYFLENRTFFSWTILQRCRATDCHLGFDNPSTTKLTPTGNIPKKPEITNVDF